MKVMKRTKKWRFYSSCDFYMMLPTLMDLKQKFKRT